jgi:hypothetical protein
MSPKMHPVKFYSVNAGPPPDFKLIFFTQSRKELSLPDNLIKLCALASLREAFPSTV